MYRQTSFISRVVLWSAILFVSTVFATSSLDDISSSITGFSQGGCDLINSARWSAALGNPAILASTQQKDGVCVENSKWFMGTSIQQLAFSYSFGQIGLNAGVTRLVDDSGFEMTSITGTANGIEYYNENIAYLAVGQKILGIDAGLSFKQYFKKAVEEKTFNSLDLGFKYQLSNWQAALKLNNIAGNFSKNDKIFYYSLGLGCNLYDFSLNIEYIDFVRKIRWGGGYANNLFSLNAGLDEDNNISAGVSVSLLGINFDYGYKNIDLLGVVNRFGISLTF